MDWKPSGRKCSTRLLIFKLLTGCNNQSNRGYQHNGEAGLGMVYLLLVYGESGSSSVDWLVHWFSECEVCAKAI
jgi:hypothetical protein